MHSNYLKSRITNIVLTVIIALMFSAAPLSSSPAEPQSTTTVYVCMGATAKSYHKKKKCSGLNNCRAEIKAITKEKAVDLGRKPCKTCKP